MCNKKEKDLLGISVGARNEKVWVHAMKRRGWMRTTKRCGCTQQEGMDACDKKAWMHVTRRWGCMRRRGGDVHDEKAGMHATKRRGCTQGETWMHAMRSRCTVHQ